MAKELTDPITLDLVEDPIVVPCCTKAFSRLSLVQALNHDQDKQCPACRQDISDFDPLAAPTNVVIASMVETLKLQMNQTGVALKKNAWKGVLTPVTESIAELKISLENSQFRVKPSLFIAVCDTSGSMSGSPWKQVETALIHIMGLTSTNPMIQTVIVRYSSFADVINTSGPREQVVQRIKQMFNSGGTNFVAAFEKVREVLGNYIYSDEDVPNAVSTATIAFLTDGQDNSHRNRDELVESFKETLADWEGPICVHSVGFSQSCDKSFLENLRLAGSIEGTFRYAEPQDDADTLCQKLTGLFEVISQNSTVPVVFNLSPEAKFRIKHNKAESELSVQFPVGRNRKGTYSHWVLLENSKEDDGAENNEDDVPKLYINSSLDEEHEIPVTLVVKDHRFAEKQKRLFEKWLATLIDQLASELLTLSQQKGSLGNRVFDLHGALIEQKVDAIRLKVHNEHSISRLEFLSQQVKSLRKGANIHEGKLSDLRFGSQFGAIKSSVPVNSFTAPISVPKPEAIEAQPNYHKEYQVRYSHNNEGKNRNEIQEAIMTSSNWISSEIQSILDKLVLADVLHTDDDGNNTLHLAAYSGHSYVMEEVLKRFGTEIDVNLENKDEESAVTLAIKRRGFWKTIKALLRFGGFVPKHRKKGLEEFAVNHGFLVTAKLLGNLDGENNTELLKNAKSVTKSMTSDYIEFLYDTAMEKDIDIDVQTYLEVCLSKTMTKLVKFLLHNHEAVPTIDMLLDYCVPPKPDHPEVGKYLALAKLVVKNRRELLQATNEDGETPLFKACERGNLPHVEYFLREYPENLEQPNVEGNTPLHIACYKQYPCIIEKLLDHGANVNYVNLKGNVPMLSSCQRGPIKIAETLLAAGADLKVINQNGDTLVLLCCRNGQHEKLSLFLNYVEPEFVDFKAHIDGFNAIFASVEANKPKCIEVLHEYGVDLEQKTDEDNQIIPGATPIHLGAYYGRLEAVQMLLGLGANPNSTDMHGMTPLHVAVIQKQPLIIKLLLNSGANPGLKDNTGSIPASYCRSNQELREILINPALDVLLSLARGEFSRTDEMKACSIIRECCGVVGCLTPKNALDLVNQDGSTPLLQAVLNSNFPVTQVLLEQMGCNSNLQDRFGLSCHVWANWIGNQRIKNLLKDLDQCSEKTQECLDRLKEAAATHSHHARILFLANKPTNVTFQLESGLDKRMEQFINMVHLEAQTEQFEAAAKEFNHTLDKDVDAGADAGASAGAGAGEVVQNAMLPVSAFNHSDFTAQAYNQLLWRAKVITTGLIASGKTTLTPSQVLAICLYTNNPVIAQTMNQAILQRNFDKYKPYLQCLSNALDKLLVLQGEVFIGANQVNRSLFQVGTTIAFQCFVSGSTSWRVATEHVTKFTAKKHEGTVFLVKSKTGRLLNQHSEYTYDMEVLFKPNTKFKVTAWYRGTVICLAQENIREHTFGLPEEEDRLPYLSNKKNLVIELTEMD